MGFFADFLRHHCDEVFTVPTHDGKPYLRRYIIMRNAWFRIFIHELLISDEDAELHDHPWNFMTFLLSGGYVEELPQSSARVHYGWAEPDYKTMKIHWPRFSLIRHQARDLHRIELEKPTWTLFIAGNKYRKWGFYDPARGWIDNKTFLKEKFESEGPEVEAYNKLMEE